MRDIIEDLKRLERESYASGDVDAFVRNSLAGIIAALTLVNCHIEGLTPQIEQTWEPSSTTGLLHFVPYSDTSRLNRFITYSPG